MIEAFNIFIITLNTEESCRQTSCFNLFQSLLLETYFQCM